MTNETLTASLTALGGCSGPDAAWRSDACQCASTKLGAQRNSATPEPIVAREQLDALSIGTDWYHAIELAPGFYTPGREHRNIALTRAILKGCDVSGASCLDIGAMDGLISVLLSRRGAGGIVACDRYDRRRQIEIVTKALDVDLRYLSCPSLRDVRAIVPEHVARPFDLIVFSGVLYHMYDPMTGLALVRSMARQGGLVVIETMVVLSNKMVGYFNAAGSIIPDHHNYWSMSVALLDYLLRFFRLKPLDCCYLKAPGLRTEDGAQVLRLCVVCEATAIALPDAGDSYMVFGGRDDNADFPEWESAPRPPLGYSIPHDRNLVRRASGAVDLFETISRTAPLAYGEMDMKLALDARF